MKKLVSIFAIAAITASSLFASAQTAKQPKPKASATASSAKHLKSDGTPDKRYKENKKAAGPTKKDGTADMRYKANKKKP